MRSVKLCIAMLFHVVGLAEVVWCWLLRRPVPSTFVVLMYHSVKEAERGRFARQMDLLVEGTCPVQADFTETGSRGEGRQYVAVTFDDGYRSVLENAAPILRDKGIPATIFLPTSYLGLTPVWITDEKGRDRDEELLSIADVKSLREFGFVMGSHGATHRPLAALSPDDVLGELVESREVLERLLEEEIRLLALPFGSSSPDVRRLAKEAGYQRVFLGDPLGSRENIDGHIAGRIGVSPTDWPLEYRLKIRGAYRWLPMAIAAKRRAAELLRGTKRLLFTAP